MNTKQFLEKLTSNWLAKVVCLIIAIFLYFFNQLSTLDKKTYVVPLTIINKGELINSTTLGRNKYIKITVRGKSDQVATLSEKDFKAYIDVSNISQEGTYDLNVCIEEDERVTALEPLELSCKPDKVSLTLEPKVMKVVKVSPTIAGELPYGYELVKVTVEPKYVQVVGAKSVVSSVNSVQTNAVYINEKTEDFTKNVKLFSSNDLINFDKNQDYVVSVDVATKDTVKTFDNIPIDVLNLNENLMLEEEIPTIQTKIEGIVVALEKLNSSDIKAFVNLSEITEPGTFEVPVEVKTIKNLNIAYISLDTITITVKDKNSSKVEEESVDKVEVENLE